MLGFYYCGQPYCGEAPGFAVVPPVPPAPPSGGIGGGGRGATRRHIRAKPQWFDQTPQRFTETPEPRYTLKDALHSQHSHELDEEDLLLMLSLWMSIK